MPRPGARILGINLPVGQAIEGHRGTPRADHAEENAQHVLPVKLRRLLRARQMGRPRHYRRQERKGERKQRMAEADHLQKVADCAEHEWGRFSTCQHKYRREWNLFTFSAANNTRPWYTA